MIALAFSGGKDSLACLMLKKDELHRIHVVWVNTGKNYPEVLETIERFRKDCPLFAEVTVDRDAQNAEFGPPSAVVPVLNTAFGEYVTGIKRPRVQSDLECCVANVARPLMAWCKEHGVKTLIRGQRLSDELKGPTNDGGVVDGIVFEHPLERWTQEEVLAYLEETVPDLPAHMYLDSSSMDCYDCTGFPSVSKDRVALMREKYPAMYAEFVERQNMVLQEVRRDLALMEAL